MSFEIKSAKFILGLFTVRDSIQRNNFVLYAPVLMNNDVQDGRLHSALVILKAFIQVM